MIGNLTKKAIIDGVTENLDIWMDEIAKAYLKAEYKKGLSISMPVTIKGNGDGVDVEVGIGFTTEKVTDSNTRTVNERQLPLKGMDSMTITSGRKSVTLDRDGIERLDKAVRDGNFPAPSGQE